MNANRSKPGLRPAYIALLLLISCSLCAQKDTLLSLAKALETASANYGAVKIKELYTQSASESRKAANREYIPALKLHGQVDYATANSVPGTYFPYGIVVPISGGISAKNNFNPVYGSIGMAYFEWAPFSFGAYAARVKESDLRLQIAGADAEQEKFYNLVYVTQAYLDALVATRLRELQEKNLERLQVVKNVVTNSAKNGLKAGVDSSFANAEVARAKLNVLEAQKGEAEQKRNLAMLMGIPTADFRLDTATFFRSLPQTGASVNSDVNSNPILKMYAARQGYSEMREKEIFRNYFPKISLLGIASGRGSGISYNGQYDESFNGGTGPSRFNYGVGLAATFNILDYPRMKAEQSAERYLSQAAKTELEERTLDLKNDLVLANEKLRISAAQMKEVPSEYAAALDFYNQKLAMYQSGLTTIIDLSQSLYNLSRAEADNAIARDAVWKALLLKAAVSGDFNLFLTNIKSK
jgi:outer membrane protein TolC